jgi:hypothetical protein
MPLRDPAQLADLDAAQLAGPQQVVHLVAAHVEHFRYLFDCVRFHLTRSPSSLLVADVRDMTLPPPVVAALL